MSTANSRPKNEKLYCPTFSEYPNHFSFPFVHFQSREVTNNFLSIKAACKEVVDLFKKMAVSSAKYDSLN